MKKLQYKAPSVKVAEIKMDTILADSDFSTGGPVTGEEEGFEKGAKRSWGSVWE